MEETDQGISENQQNDSLTRNPRELFKLLQSYIYGAIDLLASEYGWTDDYILDHVYNFEIPIYKKRISERQRAHYKMLLAIEHNPHQKDPKKLAKELDRDADGGTPDRSYLTQKLDKGSFAMLKRQVEQARATRS